MCVMNAIAIAVHCSMNVLEVSMFFCSFFCFVLFWFGRGGGGCASRG